MVPFDDDEDDEAVVAVEVLLKLLLQLLLLLLLLFLLRPLIFVYDMGWLLSKESEWRFSLSYPIFS